MSKPVNKRRLKDSIKDPKARPRRSLKRKNRTLIKIAVALVIGFAGGFGTARLIRFL